MPLRLYLVDQIIRHGEVEAQDTVGFVFGPALELLQTVVVCACSVELFEPGGGGEGQMADVVSHGSAGAQSGMRGGGLDGGVSPRGGVGGQESGIAPLEDGGVEGEDVVLEGEVCREG